MNRYFMVETTQRAKGYPKQYCVSDLDFATVEDLVTEISDQKLKWLLCTEWYKREGVWKCVEAAIATAHIVSIRLAAKSEHPTEVSEAPLHAALERVAA